MKPAYTLVVSQVVTPEGDIYWAIFDAASGEKVAPWADSDTPSGVLLALEILIPESSTD